MRKFRFNVKIIVAFILAVSSLYFLYNVLIPKEVVNLNFETYVKAKEFIGADEQLTEEMLEYDEIPSDKIPQGVVRSKEEIIGKYVTTNILKDEILRVEKVKNQIDSEYLETEREVRIYTNAQAYGGVGPGDRVDLVYTSNLSNDDKIGLLKYEGVLVKKVLNEDGMDIEELIGDKYNQGNLKPSIVVLTVNQDMALEIETLQNDREINFKLIKWTERSKKQNTENKKLFINQVINEAGGN